MLDQRIQGLMGFLRWISSRVLVIYLLFIVLILACVDLKTVEKRTKLRLLNGARPDFSEINRFQQGLGSPIDWKPYQYYFELIIKYIPAGDPVANLLLAYVYYYQHREDKAFVLLRQASAFSGDLFWPDYNLGVMYYKKGRYEEALNHLARALLADPTMTLRYMQQSIIYRQLLVSEPAGLDLSKRLSQAFSSARLLTVASLGHLKQYDRMLSLAVSAVADKDAQDKAAYFFFGAEACLQLKYFDKALLFYEQALVLDKKNPDVYPRLSRIYEAIGRREEAEGLMRVHASLIKEGPWVPYDKKIELRYF